MWKGGGWYLIDGAGDEAADVAVAAEDVRERAREGGRGLDGRVRVLADVVGIGEAEDGLDLRRGHALLDLYDVRVHVSVQPRMNPV